MKGFMSAKSTPLEGVLNDKKQENERTAMKTTSALKLAKILVPVDFSDCSQKALQYAIPLAKQHQSSIVLLHVVPTNFALGEYGGIDYASLEASMITSSEEQIAKMAREVATDVPVQTHVAVGSPAGEIIQFAKNLPADVVVISTHGRTGLQHVFLGSVVEHVVRRAPCPVFVVREHEREILAK
jgi:nucleotide-binding universal stress UspA family protein